MTDTELRINAMAAEYRATISALTERCVMLAVANAVAGAQIEAQAKEIEELKNPVTPADQAAT